VYFSDHSNCLLSKNSEVMFYENHADVFGGGLSFQNNSQMLLNNNSTMEFISNHASCGGAAYLEEYSNLLFAGSSTVKLSEN